MQIVRRLSLEELIFTAWVMLFDEHQEWWRYYEHDPDWWKSRLLTRIN